MVFVPRVDFLAAVVSVLRSLALRVAAELGAILFFTPPLGARFRPGLCSLSEAFLATIFIP